LSFLHEVYASATITNNKIMATVECLFIFFIIFYLKT